MKIYLKILDNGIMEVPDREKWTAVGLLLLAAKTGNRIPFDPKWIKNRLSLEKAPNLELLEKTGFIERIEAQTTINGLEQIEKKEEIDKSRAAAPLQEWMGHFSDWYRSYPRRRAEAEAKKAWREKCPKTQPEIQPRLERIYKRLEFYKTHDWLEKEPTYIPHPATWLNREEFP